MIRRICQAKTAPTERDVCTEAQDHAEARLVPEGECVEGGPDEDPGEGDGGSRPEYGAPALERVQVREAEDRRARLPLAHEGER